MKIEQFLDATPASDVKSVPATATLRDTAQKLVQFNVGALVVTDGANRLLGIISERDLIRLFASFDATAAARPVSDIMTRDVITCAPEDEVGYVLKLMRSHEIRHMPVVKKGALVNMLSIRELSRAYELLQIEANTDPLTELSNRRPFLKTLDTQFDSARRFGSPLSLAMIDIDHFKRVNDTYGHDAGDRVLQSISDMLIGEFRSIDLIGRLGGEEFAVVFPKTDLAGAFAACERLLSIIEAADIMVDGVKIKVTASIGLARATAETPDGAAVLKRADELLYDAKAGGRNRVAVEQN